MKDIKISKKAKKTEFVFKGKTYVSNERAKLKEQRLKAEGYKLISSNSKKLTYQL